MLNIATQDIEYPSYATITRTIETKLNLENVGAGTLGRLISVFDVSFREKFHRRSSFKL
jgi:hypothetical protein